MHRNLFCFLIFYGIEFTRFMSKFLVTIDQILCVCVFFCLRAISLVRFVQHKSNNLEIDRNDVCLRVYILPKTSPFCLHFVSHGLDHEQIASFPRIYFSNFQTFKFHLVLPQLFTVSHTLYIFHANFDLLEYFVYVDCICHVLAPFFLLSPLSKL